MLEGNSIKLGLQASDFQTARHVAETINRRFGDGAARALDGRTVDVQAPTDANARIAFIAEMEELQLESSVPSAKVVINSRTGSTVLNQAVTPGPCPHPHANPSRSTPSPPAPRAPPERRGSSWAEMAAPSGALST